MSCITQRARVRSVFWYTIWTASLILRYAATQLLRMRAPCKERSLSSETIALRLSRDQLRSLAPPSHPKTSEVFETSEVSRA